MSTCQSPTGGSRAPNNKGVETSAALSLFYFKLLSLIKMHYNINLDQKPKG